MRPRLLPDVRFVKYADGVYVHGDQGACTITGEHSHEWLSRLAPYLTGEHTLGELTESLSDERRELVERLIGVLAEQRFVTDARDEQPHTLSDEERDVYAPEIAYIRYAHDSAEHRFERLRRARIAVAATGTAGPVAAALIEAGLGSGWRRVQVTGVSGADLSAAVEAGRRDAAQQVLVSAGVPDDADVVLHVHQGEDIAALTQISEHHGQAAHGQIWVRGDEAWLTPVSDVAAAPYWRRLAGWPLTQEEPGTCLLTGPVPMVLTAQAVLSCFEYLTGLAGDAPDNAEDKAADLVMTRVDLRTLDTSRHRPRPLRLTATAVTAAGDAPTAADLLARAARYIGPRTGVLGELDEGGLVQVPWRVCAATISDPLGVLPSWASAPKVFGWGPDWRTARARALLAGLAGYQALLVAERPAVPYVAPTGVGAGLSWPQAVAAGLAQHCERMLRDRDRAGFPVVPALDDPRVVQLMDLLGAAGEQVIIRDLTTELGIPAYAAGTASPACAVMPQMAMRRALERLLLSWQARTENQPQYADPVPRWADDICGTDAEVAVETFTKALAAAGRKPRVTMLGRDAEVAALLPFVARVTCDE